MTDENEERARRQPPVCPPSSPYERHLILYNEGKNTIPCRLRDISETGAKLELEQATAPAAHLRPANPRHAGPALQAALGQGHPRRRGIRRGRGRRVGRGAKGCYAANLDPLGRMPLMRLSRHESRGVSVSSEISAYDLRHVGNVRVSEHEQTWIATSPCNNADACGLARRIKRSEIPQDPEND